MKKVTSGLSFFFHKFLLPACAYFALMVTALYLPPDTNYIKREKIFVLLLAAVGIAAINLIFYLKKIVIYFRIATHFILLSLLLLAVLYLSDYMTSGNWVIILVGFMLAYAIICPIVLILRAAKQKKEKEKQAPEYQLKFKK